MRFWSRLLLTAWLLANVMLLPAMAFGHQRCMMPAELSLQHEAGHPHAPRLDTDGHHAKADLACMIMCMNPCGQLQATDIENPSRRSVDCGRGQIIELRMAGSVPGPALEPPIPLSS